MRIRLWWLKLWIIIAFSIHIFCYFSLIIVIFTTFQCPVGRRFRYGKIVIMWNGSHCRKKIRILN